MISYAENVPIDEMIVIIQPWLHEKDAQSQKKIFLTEVGFNDFCRCVCVVVFHWQINDSDSVNFIHNASLMFRAQTITVQYTLYICSIQGGSNLLRWRTFVVFFDKNLSVTFVKTVEFIAKSVEMSWATVTHSRKDVPQELRKDVAVTGRLPPAPRNVDPITATVSSNYSMSRKSPYIYVLKIYSFDRI